MRSRERSWSENVDIIEIKYVGIHNNWQDSNAIDILIERTQLISLFEYTANIPEGWHSESSKNDYLSHDIQSLGIL